MLRQFTCTVFGDRWLNCIHLNFIWKLILRDEFFPPLRRRRAVQNRRYHGFPGMSLFVKAGSCPFLSFCRSLFFCILCYASSASCASCSQKDYKVSLLVSSTYFRFLSPFIVNIKYSLAFVTNDKSCMVNAAFVPCIACHTCRIVFSIGWHC